MIIQEQSNQNSDNTWKSWGLLARALCLLRLRRTGLWPGFPGWLGEVGAPGLPPWTPPSTSASPSSPSSLPSVTIITNILRINIPNTHHTVFSAWFVCIINRKQTLLSREKKRTGSFLRLTVSLPASTWDMFPSGCSFRFGVVLAGGSYPMTKLMVAWNKRFFPQLVLSSLLYQIICHISKFSYFLQRYTDTRHHQVPELKLSWLIFRVVKIQQCHIQMHGICIR